MHNYLQGHPGIVNHFTMMKKLLLLVVATTMSFFNFKNLFNLPVLKTFFDFNKYY